MVDPLIADPALSAALANLSVKLRSVPYVALDPRPSVLANKLADVVTEGSFTLGFKTGRHDSERSKRRDIGQICPAEVHG